MNTKEILQDMGYNIIPCGCSFTKYRNTVKNITLKIFKDGKWKIHEPRKKVMNFTNETEAIDYLETV